MNKRTINRIIAAIALAVILTIALLIVSGVATLPYAALGLKGYLIYVFIVAALSSFLDVKFAQKYVAGEDKKDE